MSSGIHRRQVLKAGSALAATAWFPLRARAGIDDVPRSPFGAASTADEVIAGVDLTGKTVLITGANSGLGYEAMRVMAAQGAHVIATGRTQEKAQAACDSVAGKTTPVIPDGPHMGDVALADRLWAVSEEMTADYLG